MNGPIAVPRERALKAYTRAAGFAGPVTPAPTARAGLARPLPSDVLPPPLLDLNNWS
jgi:hypothetical protein